jgi:hypothetical protein
VDGSFSEQFTRICDYFHELLRSNPGSTVQLEVETVDGAEENDQSKHIFQRLHICYKGCKESFKRCRPIIGLDGCFLKGPYGRQLLVAIGRDPNEQMLPIAMTVVEGENKNSWTWFLDLLISDLGGPNVAKAYTYISDQQKVNATFLNFHHLHFPFYCYSNVKFHFYCFFFRTRFTACH